MSKANGKQQHGREAHREATEHSARVGGATRQAAGQTIEDAINEPGIVEEFTDADIDDDDLADALDAEFARHTPLANITRKEYEDQRIMDRARHCLARCEFPEPGLHGSKCRGEIRQKMLGQQTAGVSESPELTGERDRELAAAFEERSNARSLAIDARLLRALTEAIAVTRSDRDSGDSDGGIIDRAVSRIL